MKQSIRGFKLSLFLHIFLSFYTLILRKLFSLGAMVFDLGTDLLLVNSYYNNSVPCENHVANNECPWKKETTAFKYSLESSDNSTDETPISSAEHSIKDSWWLGFTITFIYLPHLVIVLSTNGRLLLQKYVLHKFQLEKPWDEDESTTKPFSRVISFSILKYV